MRFKIFRSHTSRDNSSFYKNFTSLILLISSTILIGSINSLYFYLESGAERCFREELPQHTIVYGNYKGEDWDPNKKIYQLNPHLGVQITVTETDTQEVIVNTRGVPVGKFTFTSHEAGEHLICLRTNHTSSSSWLGSSSSSNRVKLHLDLTIGQSKIDHEFEKDHVEDLATRVRELNDRLKDIRSEQQYQREREILFRDLSEKTNRDAVWWSLLQIFVLIYMCVWQLRHLRTFFESKSEDVSFNLIFLSLSREPY
ncbi:emp24/gp25L/p24 family/GOLD-domain-containing protein [Phakopsora pachyrhizi]|uniref:Emp24/gp25L/p24 family/GOLD-domain-containing protein n=1 Tax=Phakopsora pachyrhizi TaxID=170000 RepID=A0AAV0BI45_PHAPC|nr:emp24/gp25L/p24 family/GOLD-domain-containing protein [Phakopsora pachyrhizi]CAH7686908.1 emp24/gp25L/p24 family/GOLD-domain-containing protein [Phakopsora pachyrhizi]